MWSKDRVGNARLHSGTSRQWPLGYIGEMLKWTSQHWPVSGKGA